MELLNAPTLPPERLIAAFEDFSNQPLASHEYFYDSRTMAGNWWAFSRLASLLYAALKRADVDEDITSQDAEGGQLGRAILDAFGEDVKEQGALFVVVHLPLQWHLQHYYQASPPRQPPFQFLLDHCREEYHCIPMEDSLDASTMDDEYWTATKHYGPAIHARVAEVVAGELLDCLISGDCRIARFLSPADYFALELAPSEEA